MTAKVSDHLANERTFLAWVRTSLGLIGLGFVLARMGLFIRQIAITTQGLEASETGKGNPALPVVRGLHGGHEFIVSGVIFLAIGTAFCAWSGWAYQRNRHAIDADRFEPDRLSVVVLTTVVALGGLALASLVLWRMLGEG